MANEKRINTSHIKYNAKLQIQKYIESFFNGRNKQFLNISAPGMVNFNINNPSPAEPSNVKEKNLQIARYFNELKNVLPAIVITDGGMANVPHSLGLFTNVSGNINEFTGTLGTIRNIEISIIIGSNDIMTTDELVVGVSHMFNEFRGVAGGNRIVGDVNKDEKWELRLPMEGIDFGGMQETAIGGDPTDRIFYCETSFKIQYEDYISFTRSTPYEFAAADPKSATLSLPSRIPFDSQTQVSVDNYTDGLVAIIDNYKIATITANGLITPRSLGKFNLKLVDPRGKVIDQKEIEII